jgi:hypothetical protein
MGSTTDPGERPVTPKELVALLAALRSAGAANTVELNDS